MSDLVQIPSAAMARRRADIWALGLGFWLVPLIMSLAGYIQGVQGDQMPTPLFFLSMVGVMVSFFKSSSWGDRQQAIQRQLQEGDPRYLLEQSTDNGRYTVETIRDGISVFIQLRDGDDLFEEQSFQGASSETVAEACEYQMMLITRAEELNQAVHDDLLERIGIFESEQAARQDLETDAIHLHHILQETRQGYQH